MRILVFIILFFSNLSNLFAQVTKNVTYYNISGDLADATNFFIQNIIAGANISIVPIPPTNKLGGYKIRINGGAGGGTNSLIQIDGIDLGPIGTLNFLGVTGMVSGTVVTIGGFSNGTPAMSIMTNNTLVAATGITTNLNFVVGTNITPVLATNTDGHVSIQFNLNPSLTNGFVGVNITNGLATINYVDGRDNLTNFVSLSTSNANSRPLTNSFSNKTLTMYGLQAGANMAITDNGSNLVLTATAGSGTNVLIQTNGVNLAANIGTINFIDATSRVSGVNATIGYIPKNFIIPIFFDSFDKFTDFDLTGWAADLVAPGTYDPDEDTIVLDGTESLLINSAPDDRTNLTNSFAARDRVNVFFKLRVTSANVTPVSRILTLWDDATQGNELFTIVFDPDASVLGVQLLGDTAVYAAEVFTMGITYDVWGEFWNDNGANSFASIGYSINGVRPESGNGYAEDTGTQSALTPTLIMLGNTDQENGADTTAYYDYLMVTDSYIRSHPFAVIRNFQIDPVN